MERLGVGLALLVAHGAASDVGLDAEDRFQAFAPGRLEKRDGAIESTVIGQREGVEAVSDGRVDEVGDPPSRRGG